MTKQNIEKTLNLIWNEIFNTDVDDAMDVVSVEGWDSVAHLTLVARIEELFDIFFSDKEAMDLFDVLEIKETIFKKIKNRKRTDTKETEECCNEG